METIEASQLSRRRWMVGPMELVQRNEPELVARLKSHGWQFVRPAQTPVTSAIRAIKNGGSADPILLTTVDHGLLTPRIVNTFVDAALASGADLAVGLVKHSQVMSEFPNTRRTGWRFTEGRYCGCNLFLLANVQGQSVMEFWQTVETHRKRPWRIVTALGLGTLLRYACGRLSLIQAFATLSAKLDVTIKPIVLDTGRAAVDIDTPQDLHLANQVMQDSCVAQTRS
jgi:GTP:adenosylcobinamide-phosphate guanylyltransferase